MSCNYTCEEVRAQSNQTNSDTPGRLRLTICIVPKTEWPFRVTWEATFYKEGAWDRPVLTGRQELVTLWKLQGIGLVKMRSDRILICLSLLCRHTDVKGKRRGCVAVGPVVIRPSRLIEKLEKKGKKGDLSTDCLTWIFVPLSSCALR